MTGRHSSASLSSPFFFSLSFLVLYLFHCYFQDDDSVDKDGNELDGECSRPQKHAKSPELAREFLLDAATIIFKEQACLSSLLLLICYAVKFTQNSWQVLLYERIYSFLSLYLFDGMIPE